MATHRDASKKQIQRNAREGEQIGKSSLESPVHATVSQLATSSLSSCTLDNGHRTPSLFDGKCDRLNLDGALYRILEYLTPSDLYTLGALTGSKFWRKLLFENQQTEYLFAPPGSPTTTKGRTHLRNLHFFRQSVKGANRGGGQKGKRKGLSKLQQGQYQEQPLNRVGVFSPQEEDSILSQDMNGYFGIFFFRPRVLAMWGDYSGIFLTSDIDELLSPGPPIKSQANEAAQQCSRETTKCKTEETDVDETPRVTCSPPQPSPISPDARTMGKEGCGYLFADSYQVMAVMCSNPYIFLGFASGAIHSVDSRPVATECGKTIEYPHVSTCRYHWKKGEISSLASVEDRHLVSACMKVNARTSEILIHWRALEDGNVRRISRIQINVDTFNSGTGVGNRAIDEIWDVSPLAMASSTFDTVCFGPVLSIAARGQNLAHFCLWTNPKESNGSSVPNTNADKTSHNALVSDVAEASNDPDKLPPIFQPRLTFHSDSLSFDYRAYRLRRTHERKSNHFVFLKYFQNTRLVVGTSKGDLLKVGMYRGTNAKPPNRSVLYGCCKGGMVEAVELVGNRNPIMITAGGYDGRIRFWDWDTFDSLGSLRIHPGQQTFFAEAALASRTAAMPIAHHRFSPVVSTFFCHDRSSLVSFCRDGHIHEWKVHEEAKKLNAMKNDEGSVKAETDTTDLNRDESLRNCHHHNTRRTRRRSRPLS